MTKLIETEALKASISTEVIIEKTFMTIRFIGSCNNMIHNELIPIKVIILLFVTLLTDKNTNKLRDSNVAVASNTQ